MLTNEKYIDGLYNQDLNVSDEKEVFSFVFENLDNEVTVYPTENYYYFKFNAQGKIFGGSLTLFPLRPSITSRKCLSGAVWR